MAITHREFFRSLEPLKRYYSMAETEQDNKIMFLSSSLVVEIELGGENSISLGALSIPRTQVDLIFHASDLNEKTVFLNRFELCFRRGGG